MSLCLSGRFAARAGVAMTHLMSFVTDRFDPAKERPNDINPIAGEAVLLWLRERLPARGYDTTMPAMEDWGWYVDSENRTASYMIGAGGDPETGPDIVWMIQISKHRSLADRLFRRNRLESTDELSEAVERLLRGEPDFRDLSVERDER
jgi:hypothetical protein